MISVVKVVNHVATNDCIDLFAAVLVKQVIYLALMVVSNDTVVAVDYETKHKVINYHFEDVNLLFIFVSSSDLFEKNLCIDLTENFINFSRTLTVFVTNSGVYYGCV